jgi:hypothetical protein
MKSLHWRLLLLTPKFGARLTTPYTLSSCTRKTARVGARAAAHMLFSRAVRLA